MRYMTIKQFRQLHEEWKQSGLSVYQYCESTGMFLLLEIQAERRVLANFLWQFHPGEDVRQVFRILGEECISQSIM